MAPPHHARTHAEDSRAATVSIWHRVGRDPRTLALTFAGTDVQLPLLKVFEYRYTPRAATTDADPLQHAFACAEHAFLIGNVDPEYLDGTDAHLAAAYRARRLRSLSFPGRSLCCRSWCCRSAMTMLRAGPADTWHGHAASLTAIAA